MRRKLVGARGSGGRVKCPVDILPAERPVAGRTPGRESDRPTGVRRRTGGDPVNHRPVERADHGRSALGLQVKLDAKRRKLVGARGFEPPTT